MTTTIAYPNGPTRLLSMLPLAGVVTLLLIYLMHRLIYVESVELEGDPPRVIQSFVMEEVKIVTNVDKKIEKPEQPQPTPDTPPVERLQLAGLDNNTFMIPEHSPNSGTQIKGNILGTGSLIRSVAAPPQYPARAIARGIEGFVDIEFDVTAYGATTNVRVLEAQPKGVFEKAATKAVARWKYKPLMVDGEASPSYGIRERVRFVIER